MLGLARSVPAQVISSGLRWQISVLFCPDRLIRDRRAFLALMAEVGSASPDTVVAWPGWCPGTVQSVMLGAMLRADVGALAQ